MDKFTLVIPITVTRLTDGGKFRAFAQVSSRTFIGASRDNPMEAVKILLGQLSGVSGSYGDDAEIALELALHGYDSAAALLADPEAEFNRG